MEHRINMDNIEKAFLENGNNMLMLNRIAIKSFKDLKGLSINGENSIIYQDNGTLNSYKLNKELISRNDFISPNVSYFSLFNWNTKNIRKLNRISISFANSIIKKYDLEKTNINYAIITKVVHLSLLTILKHTEESNNLISIVKDNKSFDYYGYFMGYVYRKIYNLTEDGEKLDSPKMDMMPSNAFYEYTLRNLMLGKYITIYDYEDIEFDF